VQFVATINGEVIALPQVVTTLDGVASTTIQVTGSGMLEIRAESEPAKRSDVYALIFLLKMVGLPQLQPSFPLRPLPLTFAHPSANPFRLRWILAVASP